MIHIKTLTGVSPAPAVFGLSFEKMKSSFPLGSEPGSACGSCSASDFSPAYINENTESFDFSPQKCFCFHLLVLLQFILF